MTKEELIKKAVAYVYREISETDFLTAIEAYSEASNGAKPILAAVRLAEKVIEVLDKKCRNGCTGNHHTWEGYQNGNGTECGVDIERLIKQAKRLLKNSR